MYGHCAEIHDRITGIGGSFDRLVGAIDTLQKHDVPVNIAVTLMKENECYYEEIKDFVLGLKVRGYKFDVIREVIDGTQNDHKPILKSIIEKAYRTTPNFYVQKLEFDKMDIDKKYFVFAVRHKLKEMGRKTHGATMKHIVKKDFDGTEIPYPPYKEQVEIANNLDKIFRIIELQNQELKLLDELVRSRFVELFGDPELNPMGWEKVTLNDVCSSIVRGPFGSALKKEFFVEPSETTYKVYEQKHAIQKSASIGTYYITQEKYRELKRFECLPGDILMSCSGTMGELYQLPEGCEKGVINQALCKFTLNDKILPVCFLVYMQQTIGKLETKGSGIQNIAAVSYIKQMPINLPPMEVQKKFERFVNQINKSKFVKIANIDLPVKIVGRLRRQQII